MRFTKMQGIGNDYIYMDCTAGLPADPSALARRMSDRHFGAGSDGLVLICPGENSDFRMRMFNSDGSESEMCGNAVRCIGKYVYERGLTDKTDIDLLTGAGHICLHLETEAGKVSSVRVDMGIPELRPEHIPVNAVDAMDVTLTDAGTVYHGCCVSMGNPHCVIHVEDPATFPVHTVGPRLETNPVFPRKANIEFVHVIDRTHVEMRVWERGAGETLACGTGACAVMTACVLQGLIDREADIRLLGGTLHLTWDEKTGHIYQQGPAAFVYDGEWPD